MRKTEHQDNKKILSGDANGIYASSKVGKLGTHESKILRTLVVQGKCLLDEEDLGIGPHLFVVRSKCLPCSMCINEWEETVLFFCT
jgi:hypothetical protein